MSFGGKKKKEMWRVNSSVCGYLWKLHNVAFPKLFGVFPPQPMDSFLIIIIQKQFF